MDSKGFQGLIEAMYPLFVVIGQDAQAETHVLHLGKKVNELFIRVCHIKGRHRVVDVEYQSPYAHFLQLRQRQVINGLNV